MIDGKDATHDTHRKNSPTLCADSRRSSGTRSIPSVSTRTIMRIFQIGRSYYKLTANSVQHSHNSYLDTWSCNHSFNIVRCLQALLLAENITHGGEEDEIRVV